jgi:hypothetical protein
MSLDQVVRWRRWTGWVAALLCIVFVVAALDALLMRVRHPENLLHLMPGESAKINGPLQEDVKDLQELTYISTSDRIHLTFEAVHSGFWLGGYLWRGKLSLDPGIQPGDYGLIVNPEGEKTRKITSMFVVKVFPDHEEYRKSSKSIFVKHFDRAPGWTAASIIPLLLLTFGAVFYLSHRKEKLLEEEGKAEIYRMAKVDGGYEINFGLGTKHGLHVGSIVAILNENGETMGQGEVLKSAEDFSIASVKGDYPIKLGYMAQKF